MKSLIIILLAIVALIIGGFVIVPNSKEKLQKSAPLFLQESQIEVVEYGTMQQRSYTLFRDKKSGFRIFCFGGYSHMVVLPPEEEFAPDKMPCEK